MVKLRFVSFHKWQIFRSPHWCGSEVNEDMSCDPIPIRWHRRRGGGQQPGFINLIMWQILESGEEGFVTIVKSVC